MSYLNKEEGFYRNYHPEERTNAINDLTQTIIQQEAQAKKISQGEGTKLSTTTILLIIAVSALAGGSLGLAIGVAFLVA